MAYLSDQHALGIDLGGTDIKVGLLNREGEVLEFFSCPTPTSSAEAIVQTISEIILTKDKQFDCNLKVGLGVPAVVNRATREVVLAPNLVSRDFPLRRAIEQAIKRPITIDNDANMAALGEWWQGAGSKYDSLILLTLGTGVGAGIIIQGSIFSGAHGWAGEIGHTIVYPNGEKCPCGKKGCLERYASAEAIARHYAAGSEEKASTQEIFSLAKAGNALAQKVINEAIDALALGVYNACLLLDPQGIIIGGGMVNAGEQLMEPLREKITNLYRAYPGKIQAVILQSKLGNRAGVVGAAKAALDIKDY